jgi:hypothetical protein
MIIQYDWLYYSHSSHAYEVMQLYGRFESWELWDRFVLNNEVMRNVRVMNPIICV